jgi:hypothetical protein
MKTPVVNHQKNACCRFQIVWVLSALLFTSCNPKTYNALFYDYQLVDCDKMRFGNRYYNSHISYSEIQNLPEPVKQYAIVSGLLDNERITELFFSYKGQIQTSEFNIRMKKNFRVSDHVSAIDPIYEATGKSFPRIILSSRLHTKGSISARFFGRNLLANMTLSPGATSDLCLLKYLAQMVWYPSAFINKYNFEWNQKTSDDEGCSNCAYLKLNDEFLVGHGKMEFDVKTGLPRLLTATVSEKTADEASLKNVSVSYHDFKDKEGYFLPSKCVATLINEQNQSTQIKMELTETIPVSISKLRNNDFMKKMEGEKKKYNKHKNRVKRRIIRRESRKQKRALRRAKRNKL